MQTGVIIVDHGSRRSESNQMLEEVATLFAERFRQRWEIVEPAHMELAEPSIASAYARCVERGATRVIVCPFFLGPANTGRAISLVSPPKRRPASPAPPTTSRPPSGSMI